MDCPLDYEYQYPKFIFGATQRLYDLEELYLNGYLLNPSLENQQEIIQFFRRILNYCCDRSEEINHGSPTLDITEAAVIMRELLISTLPNSGNILALLLFDKDAIQNPIYFE